ncbi:hypothetical protein NIASO_02235 [Niabella soli DSM 19437]|uniref:Uncharacterized protein n=1 Tax=Niabella soli DSM 19437 TaxID=929713 RepID=W0F5M6_9BACT|nr:hypothetical protein NIASO_02235 [Niabella soli DSM 19437]
MNRRTVEKTNFKNVNAESLNYLGLTIDLIVRLRKYLVLETEMDPDLKLKM